MPSNPVYPFTANSSTHQYSRNQQQRPMLDSQQYPLPTPAASTTSLLPPQLSTSRGSVRAALARAPSKTKDSRESLYMSSTMNSSPSGTLRSKTSLGPSISEKFNLSPDPAYFLAPTEREPDDYLHNPDPRRDRKNDRGGSIFTRRGFANLGCLVLICLAIVGLFAGYPIAVYFTHRSTSTLGAFNLGGTNLGGQVPQVHWGKYALVDPETPSDALSIKSTRDNSEMVLVFSDEFNTDNRTFWPGDDPYWEAVDLHYWATNNLEWYYPEAVTTSGGALQITLSEKATHNLDYQSGMVSSWNKFCFTGGTILASVRLPGINNVMGLWPAVWTMGNLGRAGFGASLEGMWPYTYDSCDVGTMPNQTFNGQPVAATENGDPNANGALSYLPGQKLSRCSCPGSDHPGPIHSEDGSFVGRSAPEIDIFEAQVSQHTLIGGVSQSGQWAPFNYEYQWFNTSANLVIPDPELTVLNPYVGASLQQATSAVTTTNTTGYQLTEGTFQTYGFEYKPGFDDAYITWIASDTVAWTLNVGGMGADSRVNISARPVPQEPMYIIFNLGMSRNFGPVDLTHLVFPAIMSIDWVRVYQPQGSVNIGCETADFPTQNYINKHIEAYTNPNLTTWRNDYGQPFPVNSYGEACPSTS